MPSSPYMSLVEPGTSIVRLDKLIIQKIAVSLKCEYIAVVTMETGLLIFYACADNHVNQGVVYLFDYSALPLYPKCPDNQKFHCTEVFQILCDYCTLAKLLLIPSFACTVF